MIIVLDSDEISGKLCELRDAHANFVKQGRGYPAGHIQAIISALEILLDCGLEIPNVNGLKEIIQQNEEAQRLHDESVNEVKFSLGEVDCLIGCVRGNESLGTAPKTALIQKLEALKADVALEITDEDLGDE